MLGMSDLLPLPPSLDLTDRKILYELEQDSRQSLGKLAKKVRISKQTLHYRIQRLVKEGVITGFITAIDQSKLGYTNHEVWIQLSELSLKKKGKFLEYLTQHDRVWWVVSCGGKFDIAIAVFAENLVQFNLILKNILREFSDYVKNYFVNISYELYTYPRTYLTKNEKERIGSFLGGEPRKMILDRADIKILKSLSSNSRIEIIELSKKADVVPNTVRSKIKKMEEVGIIQSYSIILQPTKIGIQNHEILVSLHNLSEEKEKEIESAALLNNYITILLKVVGKWNINIAFDAINSEHFQNFLIEFRTKFADIIKDFEMVSILYVYKNNYFPMVD